VNPDDLLNIGSISASQHPGHREGLRLANENGRSSIEGPLDQSGSARVVTAGRRGLEGREVGSAAFDQLGQVFVEGIELPRRRLRRYGGGAVVLAVAVTGVRIAK
jgi:hypothetical protein